MEPQVFMALIAVAVCGWIAWEAWADGRESKTDCDTLSLDQEREMIAAFVAEHYGHLSPEEQQRKQAILRIRAHFMALGYDTSDMTDEEIEEGILKIGHAAFRAGVTAEEAASAMRAYGRAGMKIQGSE